MTVAFDNFMKQYHMTGSEKADGYSADAFDDLSRGEKAIVFKLLLNELPWSARWLFLLDQDNATAIVRNKEIETRGDPYAHVYMLQQLLVDYTGDLKYQKNMMDDYFIYIERLRPMVLDALAKTPLNQQVFDFFKQVVMVEASPSALARASRHLLEMAKLPGANEEAERHRARLLKELRGGDIESKRRAILEIDGFSS